MTSLPRRWPAPSALLLSLMGGLASGLGATVVVVSRAPSYLSDAPEVCVNCHVMVPSYATWQRSSHARVAVCNDCHVPHDNVVAHYAFKARDGLRHSAMFTLRLEPQVLRASPGAVPVIQANCMRCHGGLVDTVDTVQSTCPKDRTFSAETGFRPCWDCHRDTPHGGARSLSTTPLVLVPELPSATGFGQSIQVGGRPVRPAKDTAP